MKVTSIQDGHKIRTQYLESTNKLNKQNYLKKVSLHINLNFLQHGNILC